MKTTNGPPSVPIAEGGQLLSWQHWRYAGAAANKLSDSMGSDDESFWPVYHFATLNLFESVRETLKHSDKQAFPDFSVLFEGFEKHLKSEKSGKYPHLYWDFIKKERDPLQHRSFRRTKEIVTTTQTFLWDGDPEKVSVGNSLGFDEEGECPHRLLSLTFAWFEDVLRAIDEAIFQKTTTDIFQHRQMRENLIEKSYNRIRTSGLDYNY
ncbi:hypothetical protein [Ascidiaceihabitans sp.]|uniref:hypothetical protein n=1 Tax=Ascidiaceihabitans sp. TaxID=1872644 RepID=UPI00329A1B33